MRGTPGANDFDGWVSQLGVTRVRQRAKQHLLVSSSVVVPALRRGLHHRDADVRRACVNLLDHLVDDQSVDALVAALDDPDVQVRKRALHALACDRCKENACRPGQDLWVPLALGMLGPDTDPDVRASAIDALGNVVRRHDVLRALETVGASDPDKGLRGMARHKVERIRRIERQAADA